MFNQMIERVVSPRSLPIIIHALLLFSCLLISTLMDFVVLNTLLYSLISYPSLISLDSMSSDLQFIIYIANQLPNSVINQMDI